MTRGERLMCRIDLRLRQMMRPGPDLDQARGMVIAPLFMI